jgi:hypothetical protein
MEEERSRGSLSTPLSARVNGAVSSRWLVWLARRSTRQLFFALGLVLVLPSINNRLVLDDHLQLLNRVPKPALPEVPYALFDLFTFGQPGELNQRFMERGILLPWWTDPNYLVSFFRPLSALTHAVDIWLWPSTPAVAHVHTIAWYALLLAIVWRVYARFVEPTWLGTFAFALYTLDDTHGDAVAWIANRHAVIATAFGLLAFLAHDSHRRGRFGRLGACLGPALLTLGLLSGETALAACAYLFAYAVFIDEAAPGQRVLSLLPYAAVAVVWRLVYQSFGYGASGSDGYLDPGRDPAAFLARLPAAFAALLQGQLGFFPSDYGRASGLRA